MSSEVSNWNGKSVTNDVDNAYSPQQQTPTEQLRDLKLVSNQAEEEEEEVARTTKTEKASDGGRTTTTTTMTTHKTKDGARVVTKQTRQITKVGGIGSTNYRLNVTQADDIAQRLANLFQSKSMPGTGGIISVRTENWNSKSGQTVRSLKSQSWGVSDKPTEKRADGVSYPLSADAISNGSSAPNFTSASPSQPQQPQQQLSPQQTQAQQQRAPAAVPAVQRSVTSIKQMLLDWCKATVSGYANVNVTNFSSSWNDGLAFCALIHHFYPSAFDFNSLSPLNRRYNFQLAFDTAEKYAKIAPLLDVEDMVQMPNPDWRCVFTYLQSFYRRFAVAHRQQRPQPTPEEQPSSPSVNATSSETDGVRSPEVGQDK